MKQITVVFKVDHEPGTDEHLEAILENYFRGKGIEYEDGKIIIWEKPVAATVIKTGYTPVSAAVTRKKPYPHSQKEKALMMLLKKCGWQKNDSLFLLQRIYSRTVPFRIYGLRLVWVEGWLV